MILILLKIKIIKEANQQNPITIGGKNTKNKIRKKTIKNRKKII